MRYKVCVLGATGMVGQKFVQLLENHPWFKVSALAASERRIGKKYGNEVEWIVSQNIPEYAREIEMVPLDPKQIDADIVFSALPAEIAREVEPKFAEAGFAVSSNASAFRMHEDVPLVIPEINSEHLGLIEVQKRKRNWDGFIITNPNCTSTMFVITLKPLLDWFGIKSVRIASMQALSGAGYPGVPSLAITDNVIPFIKNEEEKCESEPLKILGKFKDEKIEPANFKISASCHRVPVLDGHLEAVWVELEKNVSIDEVKDAFRSLKPLDLPSSPKEVIVIREEPDRPQPRLDRDTGNGMSVVVGRIRKDAWGIKYMVLGHNTVRGAAGASILNGELLVKEGYV
jgi:aspartate-semialdehyde dehydrogenase